MNNVSSLKLKKLKNYLFSLLVILSFLSCSKNDSNPNPPADPIVPVLPDTLSAGWSKQLLGNDNDFADIYFANNLVGYAAGTGGIFRTVDGGINWSNLNVNFNRVSNIAVTADGKFYGVNGTDTIYSIENGSTTVSKNTITQNSTFNMYDIFFTSNNNGFIQSSPLKFTNDAGSSWQNISPLTGFQYSFIANLFFLDENTGWIASSSSILRTNGSMGNWVGCIVPAGIFNGTLPVTVFAASSSVVYLGKETGVILKSTNGGANFNLVTSLPISYNAFTDLHFLSETLGYACSGNRIFKTMDGG